MSVIRVMISEKAQRGGNEGTTDCAICDAAFDECFCVGAHAYAAGAVDHAIADYSLGVKGEGRWGFVCFDGGSGRHEVQIGSSNDRSTFRFLRDFWEINGSFVDDVK